MTPRNTIARPSLAWPIACAWMLGMLCIQLLGREGPETVDALDLVALVKLAARGLAIVVLLVTLARAWHLPRRPIVMAALAPYGLFVLWAIASAAWSPLPAVTIGQAGGLVCQVLLAACIGVLWNGASDTRRILFHLTLACSLFCGMLLVAHAVSPDASGLLRSHELEAEVENAAVGLVHPTTAGATASLGLVLLLGSYFYGQWRWTRVLLAPAGAVLSLVLVLAMSRMALGMALCVVAPIVLFRMRATSQAILALAVSALAFVYLLSDPGLELTEGIFRTAGDALSRGESVESLSSFTGRTDLWDAIWHEYYKSPLVGHGYFVTSETGALDVWSGPSNRSAHNVGLQVLVSTGLVGLTLFLCGLAWPLYLAFRSLVARRERAARPALDMAALLGFALLWFIGWGQLSESFMGPVQPESVIFYSVLGLAIAQIQVAPALAPARAPLAVGAAT
jgi:O-antigen ligase